MLCVHNLVTWTYCTLPESAATVAILTSHRQLGKPPCLCEAPVVCWTVLQDGLGLAFSWE